MKNPEKRLLYRFHRRIVRPALSWLGHTILQPATRFCLFHGTSKWCWICGAACGMGPYWNGAMTCWDCHNKWHRYRSDGFLVDWRGLGRLDKEALRRSKEGLLDQVQRVRDQGTLDYASPYPGAQAATCEKYGWLADSPDGGWLVTRKGRRALVRRERREIARQREELRRAS